MLSTVSAPPPSREVSPEVPAIGSSAPPPSREVLPEEPPAPSAPPLSPEEPPAPSAPPLSPEEPVASAPPFSLRKSRSARSSRRHVKVYDVVSVSIERGIDEFIRIVNTRLETKAKRYFPLGGITIDKDKNVYLQAITTNSSSKENMTRHKKNVSE